LSLADAGSGYLLGVAVPGVLVMFGAGIAFPPIIGAATAGVAPELHGLASGVLNTARMVGGALGLAVLATIAAARTSDVGNDGLVAGFRLAYLVAAGTLVLSAALALLLPARSAGSAGRPAVVTSTEEPELAEAVRP
jgi:hypothetical protein